MDHTAHVEFNPADKFAEMKEHQLIIAVSAAGMLLWPSRLVDRSQSMCCSAPALADAPKLKEFVFNLTSEHSMELRSVPTAEHVRAAIVKQPQRKTADANEVCNAARSPLCIFIQPICSFD